MKGSSQNSKDEIQNQDRYKSKYRRCTDELENTQQNYLIKKLIFFLGKSKLPTSTSTKELLKYRTGRLNLFVMVLSVLRLMNFDLHFGIIRLFTFNNIVCIFYCYFKISVMHLSSLRLYQVTDLTEFLNHN